MGGVNLYGGAGRQYGSQMGKTIIVCETKWEKVFVFCAKLSNGDIVWIQDIYKNYYVRHHTAKCIETISSEEYIVRKLAGTLKHEIELKSR